MTRKQKKIFRRNKARLLRAGTKLNRALVDRWRVYFNFQQTMNTMLEATGFEPSYESGAEDVPVITFDTTTFEDNTTMTEISSSAHAFCDQALEHAVQAFNLPASTWRAEA